MLVITQARFIGIGPGKIVSVSAAIIRNMECSMGVDIVMRLRNFNSKTPFAKEIAMEAADEIDRLRRAIGKHKQEVWGADEPQHASDIALYKALPPDNHKGKSKT